VESERRITSKGLVSVAKRKPNPWKAPSPAKKIAPPKVIDQVANITIIRGEDRDEVNVAMEGTVGSSIEPISSAELAGG